MKMGLLIGVISLMTCCNVVAAEDKPDGLTLLKRHPEFATIIKITGYGDAPSLARVTLCRSLDQRVFCEMFESRTGHLSDLADYVYLYAVLRGKYERFKPGRGDKALASDLLQEAAEQGYAKDLLQAHDDGSCSKSRDAARCTLHKMFLDLDIQRYAVLRRPHGATFYTANENGQGDPFGL